MKIRRFLANSLIFAAIITIALPGLAYAYLDPGTGSYFFQLMLGFLVGAAFTVKLYWQKIISFLTKQPPKTEDDHQDNG